MNLLIIGIIFLSFLCTCLIVPKWIDSTKRRGFVGKDMHKIDKRKVAEAGGVAVIGGFILGVLLYVALNTFYFGKGESLIYIFAITSTILIAFIIGLIDDLLGWKKGLSKKVRLLMVLSAAVPLMVVNAGISTISIPFFGSINFGLFYPLFLIPLGVVGVTTTFNFLAGYNGLETSQGIIILTALAFVTYITGNAWLSVISLVMVASLLAFYLFNKFPSKIFPGDSLTYPLGTLIAGIAILGNIEKIAVLFYAPYIIETILKSRGKLSKESFAKINKDRSLEMPYDKIYGLEHLAIKILKKIKPSKKVYEKEVVYLINAFQIFVIILVFLFFVKV